MTELCQLEGRAKKWQLAYFGPKVDYFGHIFKDIDFKFEHNQTQDDYFSPRKTTKMAIS